MTIGNLRELLSGYADDAELDIQVEIQSRRAELLRMEPMAEVQILKGPNDSAVIFIVVSV